MKKLVIEDVVKELKSCSMETSVYIGVDSQRFKKNGKWYARYARCVILHKDSKHGGSVYGDVRVESDYGQLKSRLMMEVQFLIELAQEIMPILDGRHFEIHCDINSKPTEKSHVVMKEAMGYIYGVTGVQPKIKPESWAATHCADLYCH